MKASLNKLVAIVIILSISISAFAQKSSLKALDINLENYQYPFPVQYISLHVEGEDMKMAFMYVKPANANGHTVMLLHGKNFNGAYWRQTAEALRDNGYR